MLGWLADKFCSKYFEMSRNCAIFVAKRGMHIIKRKTLVDFYHQYPQAKDALEEWYWKTKEAQWTCFADVKRTFNSVDNVGRQHYVFNIKGNDFRLVAVIKFTIANVLIRFIGTHKQYDNIKDIQNI